MSIPRWWVISGALAALFAVWAVGALLLRPPLPLIVSAGFDRDVITPNADGDNDAAMFTYTLSRPATISIVFVDENGREYYFRRERPRSPDEYNVLFGGVVEGYVLPGEDVAGQVEARLLQDGTYTWILRAEGDSGEYQEASGTLTVEDADTALPDLIEFTVSPPVFTPNQDGLDDRAQINVYLTKDADLQVYLEGPGGERIYVYEHLEGRRAGQAGRHSFDYDGGIDEGLEPPPDGVYTVVAVAVDDEGQRIRRTATLELREGGKPLAEIVAQPSGGTVYYTSAPYDEVYYMDERLMGHLLPMPEGVSPLVSDVTVPQGDMLVFRLTVWNYGNTPIRTTGPPPGTVYQQDQRAATLGYYDESGAWRVGIDCDTAVSDYPWRWAIGTVGEELYEVEIDGITYYYLPPGAQAVVWGGIRLTDIVESRNPQFCWAGLIHEDVGISIYNNRVDARRIEIAPTADR